MKKIIIFILVLSSAVFIALSIQNFRTPTPEDNSPDILYSTVIEKNSRDSLRAVLKDKFHQPENEITAVFFMYSKSCNACFNEVHEYIDVLDKKNMNIEESIFSYGIFHHVDVNVANRFKVTTDLNFDEKSALDGKKLIEKGLLIFKGDNANNQLVLFNSKGNLFGRILLPTGIITSREKKNEVINLLLNRNS